MAFEAAPLTSGFMLVGMIGLILSILYIPKFSIQWAFAFGLIFAMMLVASFISMTRATPDEQLMAKPRKIK